MMQDESFWLTDMIVLGQGAPNRIRKIGGQQGRCLCLWSERTGFVRVYPVPHGYVKDWDIINVEVRKPTNDGRENSFVVSNYEKEWYNLSKRIYAQKETTTRGSTRHKQLTRKERLELLEQLSKTTFSKTRDNEKSFGLIKPKSVELFLKQNREKSQAQATLFDLDYHIMDQNDFAYLPYLRYECDGVCTSKHPHEQKIVEWGAYQFMRQNPNSKEHCERLVENYHIGDEEYIHYILIGNIRKYTKTYVVVKLIRFKIGEIE